MFSKHIDLTSAYLDDVAISFIIKSCRLKPRDLIFGDWTEKLILYRHWIDEYGNILEITEKKKIKICLNDLSIPKDKITTSDLYENLPIHKVAKISKLAFFLIGKDEDQLQDHAIVSLLGVDGFLRSYCLIYGEWRKIPSLYLGFHMLRQIALNDDIKYFMELKVKDMPYPCINAKAALSFMPLGKDFLAHLKRWNESVFDMIVQER